MARTGKILLVFGFFDGIYYGEDNRGPFSLPLKIRNRDDLLVVPFNIGRDLINKKTPEEWAEQIKQDVKSKLKEQKDFKPEELKIIINGHGSKNGTIICNMLKRNDPRYREANLYELGFIAGIAEREIRKEFGEIKESKAKFLSCASMQSPAIKEVVELAKTSYREGVYRNVVRDKLTGSVQNKIYIDFDKAVNDIKKSDFEKLDSVGFFLRGAYDRNPHFGVAKVSGVHGDAITSTMNNAEINYSTRHEEGGAKIIFKSRSKAEVLARAMAKELNSKLSGELKNTEKQPANHATPSPRVQPPQWGAQTGGLRWGNAK